MFKLKNIVAITLTAISVLFFSCKDETLEEIEPATNTLAQGNLETVTTLGGSKNESGQAVAKTTDGGCIVLGFTQSMDGDITTKTDESYDVWVLKYNEDLTLEWTKTFGGTNDERGHDIIQTQDGGYAIIGFTYSTDGDVTANNGQEDFWIIKLDAQGNLLWEKTYGYSGIDTGHAIIQTNDGGYFITGVLDVTSSGGAGNTRSSQVQHAGGDYWALKLDPTGNIQWSKYFGGFFSDTAYDAIQTNDDSFIIIGSSDSEDTDISNNIGSYDFWIIKTSNTGETLWEKSFGTTEIDEARAVINTSDGNYLIIGDTRGGNTDVSSNSGAADVWVIKVSPNGELLWEKTYGGEGFDVGRDIATTNDDGYIISGSSRSASGDLTGNQGQNDAWVFKIDNTGNLKWQKTVGGSNVDFAYSVTELNNGKIIAVGESSSNDGNINENKGFTDLLLIEIN
ncbi:hypothetical protein [Olleya namhaensis]|uniref:Bulb-type lectin domain-containing protein n=1 Tax=Olleya namhaensis TaxID=1144750 RepID=A0A1I3S5N9_9FLAO|nr:hypothetical protein [Olleya namhaensis]SFJ54153.1 hypothetical protein SAMN05443431_10954 [Olleya namhaensis]